MTQTAIVYVECANVKPQRFILRDNLGDIQGLADNIKLYGLKHPISVRELEDKTLELMDGQRRLTACKDLLKWQMIPANVEQCSDETAFVIGLSTNEQNKPLEPLEKAEAFRRYQMEYGFGGMADLARKIGKSLKYVSNYIAMLDLPEEVKEELLRQRKAPSIVDEIRGLKPTEQIAIVNEIKGQPITKDEMREVARRIKSGQDVSTAWITVKAGGKPMGEAKIDLDKKTIEFPSSGTFPFLQEAAEPIKGSDPYEVAIDDFIRFTRDAMARYDSILTSQVNGIDFEDKFPSMFKYAQSKRYAIHQMLNDWLIVQHTGIVP